MTGEPLHHYPEKDRTVSAADFLDRFGRSVVNLFDFSALELLPFLSRQNSKGDRINLAGRTADAVGVVLDNE